MGSGFKADRDNLPWARADGVQAGPAPFAAVLAYNCTLPPGTPMVRGEGEPMSFQNWDCWDRCMHLVLTGMPLLHVWGAQAWETSYSMCACTPSGESALAGR